MVTDARSFRTRNEKRETMNHKRETINEKRETINAKPETLNFKLFLRQFHCFNHKTFDFFKISSIVGHQATIIDYTGCCNDCIW